jgi:hypothetical protein
LRRKRFRRRAIEPAASDGTKDLRETTCVLRQD